MKGKKIICDYGKIQIYDNPVENAKYVLIVCHGVSYSYEAVYAHKIQGKSIVDMWNKLEIAVVGFDVVGYGKSELANDYKVNSDIAVANLKEVVLYVKEHYVGAKIVIMGWSWGAQIAGKYAMYYPKLVSKFILYGLSWHINKRKLLKVYGVKRENTMEHAKSDFSCIATIISEEMTNDFAKNALQVNPNSFNEPIQELASLDYLVEPNKIFDPVLVINGSEDERIDILDVTRFFMELKSNIKIHISYVGGHGLHLEKYRDRFCSIVAMFIREDEER